MNDSDNGQAKNTPPYLSPVTFFNFVEAHRRTLPDRIDRSLMTNLSGTDQPRILAALRFFSLISEDGKTQPAFQKLRDLDEETLKSAWATLLRAAYPYLFDGFNLAQATQGQIEERFREQGIKGDTVRKGVAFFVAMARTAGIELSTYIKATRLRASTGGVRPKSSKVGAKNGASKSGAGGKATPPAAPPTTDLGTIAATWGLTNGGVVTLSVTGDAFSLTKKERDDLFTLADTLKEYDAASPAPKGAKPAADGAADS